MKTIRLGLYIGLLIFSAFLVFRISQYGRGRDKIEFNDPFESVQDSISGMQSLMKKLPRTNRINYFVDDEGYLYVNNTRMTKLERVIDSRKVRGDTLFLTFSNAEFHSFCTLIHFLKRNNVESASFEPSIGEFAFGYREVTDASFGDIREIILPERKVEFMGNIKGTFRILEQRGKLILIAPL